MRRMDRRSASISRLVAAFQEASDDGDMPRCEELIKKMVDIACRRVAGYDGNDSFAAFQWVAANDGGLLNEAVRKELWRNPEIGVDLIRTMRAFVHDPARPRKQRAEANRVLKKYGFDDESLTQDHEED
jgi:hypothetical protein